VVNRSSDFIVTKSPHIAKRENKLDTACKFGRNFEEDTNYPCNGTSSSCSKPHQGSQWATFRFYCFYPTSSSLFEQSLLSTSNQVTLQDNCKQMILAALACLLFLNGRQSPPHRDGSWCPTSPTRTIRSWLTPPHEKWHRHRQLTNVTYLWTIHRARQSD
jgi:hypothetical protein